MATTDRSRASPRRRRGIRIGEHRHRADLPALLPFHNGEGAVTEDKGKKRWRWQ